MEVLNLDTLQKFSDLLGFKLLHPQAAVVHIDSSMPAKPMKLHLGFYCVYLKKTRCCNIDYGRTKYDFDLETLVCFAPGQTVEIDPIYGNEPETIGLLFHPDFIHRTPLAQKIKDYEFFSYSVTEALHLSDDEKMMIENCMNTIEHELEHPIDKFSKSLIVPNIEVLLNYCMRFYERQFVTREKMNTDVLSRFEALIHDYLYQGIAATEGVPSVKYFADKICLSPNYFSDLVKSETGKTANEYIQLKMLEKAKADLNNPALNAKQISASLGFQNPQHFSRFFKRRTGVTPHEFQLGKA